MIDIKALKVSKKGKLICNVPSLQVGSKQRLIIRGENGAGKSTLLRVLAGLEGDYEGKCESDCPLIDRVFVHQRPYLFRGSVLFNVSYALRSRGHAKALAHKTALEWLSRLGIKHLAQRTTAKLSGGEARRVALARAFVLEPALLLLDEPIAELDSKGIQEFSSALEHLPHSTILMASPIDLPTDLDSKEFQIVKS